MAVIAAMCLLVVTVASRGDTADHARTGVRTPSEPVLPFDPNRVLLKNGNGDWVVPWSEIVAHVATLRFDPTKGEPWHRLHPEDSEKRPVFAGIVPVQDIWDVPADQLMQGRIVAAVYSTGFSRTQPLLPGENFLLVWWDGSGSPRMAVLNRMGRLPATTFEVAAHGDMQGGRRPTQQEQAVLARAKVSGDKRPSPAMLRCVDMGWKACFIDDPQQQRVPFNNDPPGWRGTLLGIDEPPQVFTSQPWVSCLLFGCCCGGTQCHY